MAASDGPGAGEATCVRNGQTYNIFFLRGHMRSGTNWCARLLQLHPRIAVKGEYHFEMVAKAIERYTSEPWSLGSQEPLKSATRALLKTFVRDAMATLADERPEVIWLGDQTPAPIDPLLGGARHICMVRDGRDVLVSWTFHQLRLGGLPSEPHRSQLAELVRAFQEDSTHFKRYPEQLLSVEPWVRSQATHWKLYIQEHLRTIANTRTDDPNARILLVKYEDLHADTEGWRRKMYNLLDLDPDYALPISPASKTTPGFDHDDPTQFNRRGQPGDWRNYFTHKSLSWFEEEAGAELRTLEYS